ncbi:DUF4190 domain-containing protein [Streptomyces sp. ISL-96]|uniref:DUF4190 domain-containing protein n=1 Tax=Streptomyces sp. ISL-96 TaxID=2819191 RepID=UPI001BE56652|nr:DUF4190 domain-containing protein [Streptomyces sp. ISL-96]MBT2491110.1 DUF4190 domain-containing protein [Streptomyces sp. ISL-96]
MSDNANNPSGPPPEQSRDPWAPPDQSAPKVPLDKPPAGRPPVHDQQTVTSMPAADPVPGFGPTASVQGAVPPPPAAPVGQAQGTPGQYGYPAAYPAPSAPAPYNTGGYPGYPGYGGPAAWTGQHGPAPANGFGVTAMVLGIISVTFFCAYGLGIILGILALIFGILGRKRVARGEATNSGMALAGIILGVIGFVLSAAFIGFVVWAIVQGENGRGDLDSEEYDPYANSSLVIDAPVRD